MKANKFYTLLLLIMSASFSNNVLAQWMPEVAKPQTDPILLRGGTVHTGDGQVLENTAVGFDQGKITYLGTEDNLGDKKDTYKIIDISGQHVYPGFILLNSTIGIQEISAVPHSNDVLEEGDFNPNLNTMYAYDTGSTYIPTLRFNGILYVESIRPRGVISGTSSVMELDGWNWQDAVFKKEAAIHLHWPSSLKAIVDKETNTLHMQPNPSYKDVREKLENLFVASIAYHDTKEKPINLKLEALEGLYSGNNTLVIHANEPKEIIEGISFAQKFGVKNMALEASNAVLKVKSFLKAHDIPVILPPTYNLPRSSDLDYDTYYTLPNILIKEGIVVALNHSGSLSNAMNLPFYAGTAAAFGLDKEEALKTITLNPAKILGIDNSVGSIAMGKDASLFVSKGDALDIQSNALSMAFIRGKKLTLDGPHQENFKIYSEKYSQKD
ncbi:amidohydrolase family protein [Formosa sediminum]|uniref:Amidohydrolase family protein n=1 Tax=Formosa sediminum TaxID=2594004 RepID=A0A516GTQ9_9FLAO|nr:amidohydrolase family protein [Formosa sediminum]QDO94897.1 amidohydrolase family protein [Formosa sediminum]